MGRVQEDKDRERRKDTEILFDNYEEETFYLSWYYYLQNKMNLPFKAWCTVREGDEPLSFGDEITVSGSSCGLGM